MIRRPVLLLLLSSLLTAAALAAPVKDTFKDAPDVTLTSVSGQTVHLSSLRGKVVLLDFWASWCIPCRKSFPEMESLHRELQSKGLALIAVNVDEEQKNAHAFLEQFPHTMTVALDPKGTIAEAFKVNAMPSTMILDRAGRIRYSHKGYTDKSPATFRAQVLQLIAETE